MGLIEASSLISSMISFETGFITWSKKWHWNIQSPSRLILKAVSAIWAGPNNWKKVMLGNDLSQTRLELMPFLGENGIHSVERE